MPGERTREVTLDPGASADTPDKQIRVRQEPARADAGHPLHVRAVAGQLPAETDSRRPRPHTTGQNRHSRPGTTRRPRASTRINHRRRRRMRAGVGGPGPADRPEPGTVIRLSPGPAPSRVKIHRHTAAGLAPITWPGSVSSGATPHTIESTRRLAWIRRVGVGQPERTAGSNRVRVADRPEEPMPGLAAADRAAHRITPGSGRDRVITPCAQSGHARNPFLGATLRDRGPEPNTACH